MSKKSPANCWASFIKFGANCSQWQSVVDLAKNSTKFWGKSWGKIEDFYIL